MQALRANPLGHNNLILNLKSVLFLTQTTQNKMPNQDAKTVDYSFLGIVTIKDAVDLEKEEHDSSKILTHKERRLLRINTVNFSANKIVQINDLPISLTLLQLSPTNIKWLDLSNNKISSLENAFETFDNLTVLYLHANEISSIKAIKPLEKLKKLTSLTLHGNPIEEQKHFRNYTMYLLPTLEKLNFSLITNRDREKCKTWSSLFRNKLSNQSND
jgi:Leucine-rich repeat (LRR) protein